MFLFFFSQNKIDCSDEEEARRLREERKKQQDLLALLSQQLKKAENSMKGIEQEADELRRELIKREQARKSGYLMVCLCYVLKN